MNATVQIKREVEGALNLLSEATLLFDESHALTYALVMALANTPRKQLSQQEIDGLCQLAYELLNKLNKTNDIFQETRQKLIDAAAVTDRPNNALRRRFCERDRNRASTAGHTGQRAVGRSAKPWACPILSQRVIVSWIRPAGRPRRSGAPSRTSVPRH